MKEKTIESCATQELSVGTLDLKLTFVECLSTEDDVRLKAKFRLSLDDVTSQRYALQNPKISRRLPKSFP